MLHVWGRDGGGVRAGKNMLFEAVLRIRGGRGALVMREGGDYLGEGFKFWTVRRNRKYKQLWQRQI